MAIRINLDLMLVKRGVKLTQLAEAIGITVPNLSNLKTNKARAIRFSTLDAICKELNCQPGDLLEYVPEDDGWPDLLPLPGGGVLVSVRQDLTALSTNGEVLWREELEQRPFERGAGCGRARSKMGHGQSYFILPPSSFEGRQFTLSLID
jgi:putative transcriptional regulator